MRLIDANEFKKRIDHYPAEIRDIAKKELRYVPTIEAEPIRHGRWIVDAEDWRHQIEWYKCSQCDFESSTAYKYCPNCGARMVNDDSK